MLKRCLKLDNMLCKGIVISALLLVSQLVQAHDGESHVEPNPVINKAAKTSQTNNLKVRVSNNRIWDKNYFPNPVLITQDGEKVKFFDDLIKDKVVAINFIYTNCTDSCPLETARLLAVQKLLGDRMGKDIHFYSISLTPEKDTPSVLKEYMEKYHVGPGWTFLTGNEQDIILLRKKLGLYLEEIQNNKDNPDDHNVNLIIGNQASGRWMKRSPFENPYVLASQLGDWLHNWKNKPNMSQSYEKAPELRQVSSGELLFRTRCSSCHNFTKDGVGPKLAGVVKSRDRKWLQRWLKEPDKMLAEKDPLAMSLFKRYKLSMPNMRLTLKDVNDLIDYMQVEDDIIEKAASL